VAKYWDGADGLDSLSHALAHAGRRRIVTELSRRSASSSRLAELLDIGLPALHKHLELLRAASVIRSTKSGRTVTHTLQPEALDALANWIVSRKAFWDNQFDALADHLEKQ